MSVSTLEFLGKHLGHRWTPVSVDPSEYGMLGEPISITMASERHPANAFQSTPLSEVVARETADQLARYGFENPKHFTKVDTGNGIALLITQSGFNFAKENHDFLRATAHRALIGDTGIVEARSAG